MYKELVRGVRAIRTERNVPYSVKTEVFIVPADSEAAEVVRALKQSLTDMERLLFAKEVKIVSSEAEIPEDTVVFVGSRMRAGVPLSELVDREKETARLLAEKKKAESELTRAEGMLANPRFVEKAPAAKVEEERAKIAKYKTMIEQLDAQLAVYGA